ncbi:alpha/beta hydrolase [Spirillospora sp. CA-142024]|uniref:alpha/beta hydrolase n=1 Tax=Spirillospora sp. CA-142024 TaxID=3240036 RepID=UPI003D90C5E3
MPIDPVVRARLGSVTADVPLHAALQDVTAGYRMPEVKIEETAIDGPRGPIRIRLYRPDGAASPCPGLLWLHGGGWARGDLDMPEAHVVAAELAARPGAVVASVEYRLAAGASRYPVPLDDVHAAWRWFTGAAAELGADPRRLAIGGCSAGGNLAAGAAARARDEADTLPSALLLAYPFLHFPVPAPPGGLIDDLVSLPERLRFTAETVLSLTHGYVGRVSGIPAHAMPGNGAVGGLPRTFIVLSEIDELRPSGELFARQLRECGIPVETMTARGLPHGHLNLAPVDALPEIRRSIDFLGSALA